MLRREGRERVVVLVKALPHVGERHGETVCCAGVTLTKEWRRQFPIHFRRLSDKKFKRWQLIEYDWRAPKDDNRPESRRVQEDSIKLVGELKTSKQRAEFLRPVFVPSLDVAVERGQTLALIRPKKVVFTARRKSSLQIGEEKQAYRRAAAQASFLDPDLRALVPCPFEFNFAYETEDGKKRSATCDDWETTQMFHNFKRLYGESDALRKMADTFNIEYPKRGMAFAMGTHSRFPQTWLLVGVLRVDEASQFDFDL